MSVATTAASGGRIGPVRVSVFMNRSNQAVRIPKEMSFPEAKELEMQRVGDVITLRPLKPTWESFFDLAQPLSEEENPWTERHEVLADRDIDWGDLMESDDGDR